MRQELKDKKMELICGGTVIISSEKMMVAFSTTRERFDLKNCTFRQARDYVADLLAANPGLNDAEFDALAKQKLAANGWI